ncbi:MAG: hypothetical protein M0031_09685 [Thermaerobacter sp.]|nr:hypothetical protein [Thermaerobacter sp.]
MAGGAAWKANLARATLTAMGMRRGRALGRLSLLPTVRFPPPCRSVVAVAAAR